MRFPAGDLGPWQLLQGASTLWLGNYGDERDERKPCTLLPTHARAEEE